MEGFGETWSKFGLNLIQFCKAQWDKIPSAGGSQVITNYYSAEFLNENIPVVNKNKSFGWNIDFIFTETVLWV